MLQTSVKLYRSLLLKLVDTPNPIERIYATRQALSCGHWDCKKSLLDAEIVIGAGFT